jgi:hypothetical protein
MRSALLAIALLACLACADVASAAGITLGTGRHPDVAVDENRTAHVVWDAVDTGADRLFYCQVPRGAKGCTNARTFTPPQESIGRSSYVFAPGGGRVLIASFRCCGEPDEGLHVFESTDGGLTFGPGRNIGSQDPEQNAVLGPGNSISSVNTGFFQNATIQGGRTTQRAELPPGFSVPTYASVALYNGTIPVFARADGDDTTFHVWSGNGNLNNPASWTGPTVLPPGNEVVLAGGPAGLDLLYLRGKPGKRYWGARKFDGTTFGSEVRVTEAGDPIFAHLGTTPLAPSSFQAVWVDNRTPNRLKWARSADGVNWSEHYVAASDADADRMFNLRVAAASDGRAFVVWDQNANSGSTKGLLLPAKGKGPPLDAARRAQFEFQFYAPFPCAPQSGSFDVTMTPKTVKSLPNRKRVKVTRVRYTFDSDQELQDDPPFGGAQFDLGESPAGSAHKLRAVVSYKPLSGGSTKTVTLSGTGFVCP